MWKLRCTQNKKLRSLVRGVAATTLLSATLLVIGFSFVLWSQQHAYERSASKRVGVTDTHAPFPLGVDPVAERITEQPAADTFYRRHIAGTMQEPKDEGWLAGALTRLGQFAWVQNLASPASRVLVIEPGERHEEVVDNFGDILRWNNEERQYFRELVASAAPKLREGKFYPEHYIVATGAPPEEVAALVLTSFESEVLKRYTPAIDATVPLSQALTIASLLEREAYSFADMRNISGIIWNRLFVDMPLQIDASLQYVKGSRPYGPWWPQVTPSDKFLSSPFNTYEHAGLPPSPIANPSLAAIVAALNPRKTDCLFYFHNAAGEFFCANDYDTHVDLLRQEYGRGR